MINQRVLFLFFLWGLISCRDISNNELACSIHVDSISTNIKITKLFEYYGIVMGVHPIQFSDGKQYIVVVNSPHSLALINTEDSTDSMMVNLLQEVNGISTHDSTIYVLTKQKNYIKKVTFRNSTLKNVIEQNMFIPTPFTDSVFISATIHNPIISIGVDSLLIPYRVRNGTPNLNDEYAFILTSVINDSTLAFSKHIKAYWKLNEAYDYYNKAVCAYDDRKGIIYYTFQKCNYLFSYNLNTNAYDSVKINGLQTTEFEKGQKRNFSYLRQYLTSTDVITGIFTNSNSSVIYIVTDNNKSKPKTSTVRIFDKDFSQIGEINTEVNINTEISYLKDNKLHIYVSGSTNDFLVFHCQ